MNTQQPNVGKYYNLLLSLKNDGRFDGNFIGKIKPFFPSDDEKEMIQYLRKEWLKSHKGMLDSNLATSLSPIKMLEEWLENGFDYHFAKTYSANTFTPISVTTDNESDRLRIIDNLGEDLGGWDFIQYLNQVHEQYQDSGPEIEKIEWIASQRALGYIMYELASKGYIKVPQKSDGEIDYTAFSELLKQAFSGIKSTDNLRQALNPDSDKRLSEEKQKRFRIPDVKEIS
ncbi:hypothetical protein [Salmonirosea aquatica]|uniref:Uncharacterized protein n=1 Tax=Salmonirosea aquatica TaxID=2654236 RepID=A0A7C9B872_9BACT|nr:hypothetical protein [Cytophagaceae bacterium SJW1-29]